MRIKVDSPFPLTGKSNKLSIKCPKNIEIYKGETVTVDTKVKIQLPKAVTNQQAYAWGVVLHPDVKSKVDIVNSGMIFESEETIWVNMTHNGERPMSVHAGDVIAVVTFQPLHIMSW